MTLLGVKSRNHPQNVARAQVVINSAKVEVEYLKLHDGRLPGTGFIPLGEAPVPTRPMLRATS